MDKLTTERLEEMKSNVFSLKSISEAEQIAMIDELLSLRTAAAPGMEEKMFPLQTSKQSPSGPLQIPWSVAEVAYGAYVRMYGRSQSLEGLAQRGGFSWYEMDQFHPGWRKDASEIESLHQRLREAQAEIEQNDGRINRLNQTCNELHDTIRERESQIATLAAERDEAKSGNDFLRQEIEDWKEASRRAESERDEARKEAEQFRSDRETVIHNIQKLNQEFIELTAELAALRSCPAMGEVDDILTPWVGQPFKSIVDGFEEMRAIARRAIASHATEKQRAEEAEALAQDSREILMREQDQMFSQKDMLASQNRKEEMVWASMKMRDDMQLQIDILSSKLSERNNEIRSLDRQLEEVKNIAQKQLAERDAEIERLKEQIAAADESLRLERSVTDQQHQERIATLTSERDEARRNYDRFLTEWFDDGTDYRRLVDVAESHVDPDCWLSVECRRIHDVFLKRYEEQQNGQCED